MCLTSSNLQTKTTRYRMITEEFLLLVTNALEISSWRFIYFPSCRRSSRLTLCIHKQDRGGCHRYGGEAWHYQGRNVGIESRAVRSIRAEHQPWDMKKTLLNKAIWIEPHSYITSCRSNQVCVCLQIIHSQSWSTKTISCAGHGLAWRVWNHVQIAQSRQGQS